MTQEQFEDISVAAVTELWSRFGTLAEIWFDGGISATIHDRIVHLLATLQPQAVTCMPPLNSPCVFAAYPTVIR